MSNIIIQSWRGQTRKQYQTYINRWISFSSERQVDPVCPPLNSALEFLANLFEDGLSYSVINSARSAMSSFIEPVSGVSFGSNPMVVRFMKGVFQQRPATPRYVVTWDVGKVLDYLICTLWPHSELNLKDLTLKMVMLMALVSAQRGQTIHLLRLDHMFVEQNSYTFRLSEHVKQSRPGKKGLILQFFMFPHNKKLCVYTTIRDYLQATCAIRNEEIYLLISYIKPHKRISRDSLSRWVKLVLSSSGIDTTVFKAHSTRAAFVSKAKAYDISISDIMAAAGWDSSGTFAKFYDKSVTMESNFATSILTNY